MESDDHWKRVVFTPISKCVKNVRHQVILPKKPLTNEELSHYAYCLNIPFFRGVFMRDRLPKHMWNNETAIVNLDDSKGSGTHWVCYKKLLNNVYYFDSAGNLPPPKELMKYFNVAQKVFYNSTQLQHRNNTYICGHLCLDFLATSISLL